MNCAPPCAISMPCCPRWATVFRPMSLPIPPPPAPKSLPISGLSSTISTPSPPAPPPPPLPWPGRPARGAGEGERLVRKGAWPGWHPVQMLGMHVTGRTVGIIGMGRIGKAIAHRCHYGFGMQVVFHNRSPVTDTPYARQVPLAQAMAADIVVTAVPGGAETRHLINAETLRHMAPHAIFINIARGDVVDETALIAALQSRQIAGAGLDVYEHEPHIPPTLMALENVTLLPHLGTAALEVRENMGHMAVANLIAHLEGRPLPNPV